MPAMNMKRHDDEFVQLHTILKGTLKAICGGVCCCPWCRCFFFMFFDFVCVSITNENYLHYHVHPCDMSISGRTAAAPQSSASPDTEPEHGSKDVGLLEALRAREKGVDNMKKEKYCYIMVWMYLDVSPLHSWHASWLHMGSNQCQQLPLLHVKMISWYLSSMAFTTKNHIFVSTIQSWILWWKDIDRKHYLHRGCMASVKTAAAWLRRQVLLAHFTPWSWSCCSCPLLAQRLGDVAHCCTVLLMGCEIHGTAHGIVGCLTAFANVSCDPMTSQHAATML